MQFGDEVAVTVPGSILTVHATVGSSQSLACSQDTAMLLQWVQQLKKVYNNDIEAVDYLVGIIPAILAITDTCHGLLALL
jgi:hypothetical protein